MKIRLAIREQLAVLVTFAVLVALAVVSVPTWIFVNRFVTGVEKDSLALTASLKAARISAEIELVQTTVETISTRLLLQQDFEKFYVGNYSGDPIDDDAKAFASAGEDLASALDARGEAGLYQARLYSRNTTGNPWGLLNVTGKNLGTGGLNVQLPYLTPEGTKANLSSNETWGYPPMLYPNITYVDLNHTSPYLNTTESFSAQPFPGIPLTNGGGMLLGPLIINSTFALISITVPINSNLIAGYVLGYMTLVASATSLVTVVNSNEGLGSTGQVLIIGPNNPWNRFNISLAASNTTWTPPYSNFSKSSVQFLLPPTAKENTSDRHSQHNFASGAFDVPFQLDQYPAALDVLSKQNSNPNNQSSFLSTTNEQGIAVAVGVARPGTNIVTWAVLVEQAESEAYAPISNLRKILLSCVFGTLGVALLFVFPCAHWSVLPIRRLKEATEKSVSPPGYEDDFEDEFDEENPSSGGTSSGRSEKGMFGAFRKRMRKRRRARARAVASETSRRQQFKIPARVQSGKHLIHDELTELTDTFNQMTDELFKQYTSLDEKVAERTRELEISKKAAEAANESKTLFIANISHELKTPLNGIMGMCAVCMEEDDLGRIKQSLKTLSRSGDLLLHLLDDLLRFSKNQIGQQVNLEEREFRLAELRSQIISIFDKQVRENKITFTVSFVGSENMESTTERTSLDMRLPALGPPGMGRLKDVCLWGDQHRILQVIINLVSNSLKFTPAGGKVDLRIRCVGEIEQTSDESRTSSFSKTGSNRGSRGRHRLGSGSTHSASSKADVKGGTALSINPMDPKATPHVYIRERSPTPPPPNAKSYWFEFEVQDTGPGIAEHMQQKIFEPFVQGDLGLSKKFGGTGLGLSICSQLANIMGGTIELKSTEGVGSTFTMRIPLKYVKDRASSTASSSVKSRPPSVGSTDLDSARKSLSYEPKASTGPSLDKQARLDKQPRLVGLSLPFFTAGQNSYSRKQDQMAAIDRAVASKAGRGKLRVLVADDNSTNIEVVSRMLKLEEIVDVTIAQDGQEAFDLVKANMEADQRFDLIFMDIQMPNVDGLQSTRLIRKMGYSAPIVALTAFSEESNVKECMESGMDEFLSKPIRRPALKKVLQKFSTILEEPEPASQASQNGTDHGSEPAGPAKPEATAEVKTNGVPPVDGDSSRSG